MRRFLSRHAGAWLSLLVAAAGSTAQADTLTVPFTAAVNFTETVNFTFQLPCFAYGSLSGSGFSRPLGAIQASSQDCINPLGSFDPNGPSFVFASLPPGFVLTAANGDRLIGSYAGSLAYHANAPYTLSGFFVITSGTGHYQGATGGGTVSGTEVIGSTGTGRGVVMLNGQLLLAR